MEREREKEREQTLEKIGKFLLCLLKLLNFIIILFFGHLIIIFKPFYIDINKYIKKKNKFYSYQFKPGVKLLIFY